MLSIRGDDLVKLTSFLYWGDDLTKMTRLQIFIFCPQLREDQKKGHNVPRRPIFCPK